MDIYSMSRCDFFVHGFSAMAEATVYIQRELHNRSANVDIEPIERMSADDFRTMVSDFYVEFKVEF